MTGPDDAFDDAFDVAATAPCASADDTGADDAFDFAAGATGGPRVLWELTARIRLHSDTHIGSADDASRTAADIAPLDRDPVTGAPRLRATTQAGLLRHHLLRRLGEERAPAAAELFGEAAPRSAEDGSGASVPSALDIDDAVAELPAEAGVTVRAGNRVDPGSGAAAPGATWRMETLPAGTAFTLTLRLHVADGRSEGRMLALAALAADGLTGTGTGAGVSIGARTARGYGAAACEGWHARRHDLAAPQGWARFYAVTWAQRRDRAHRAVAERCRSHSGAHGRSLTELLGAHMGTDPALAAAVGADYRRTVADYGTDDRRRDELALTLHLAERPTDALLAPAGGAADDGTHTRRPGLLLVGEAPGLDTLGEVDRAHLRRPAVGGDGAVQWRPTLGDTALFALFKRMSRRLVRDISGESGAAAGEWSHDSPARRLHARWWGGDADSRSAPRASAVRLRQAAELTGGTPQRTTRVTIDALFGDSVDASLLTDDVHAGGSAEVVLDVPDPDDAVRGLLALIVRELRTVPMDAVGGGTGAGHGRVTVSRAVLTRCRPGAEPAPVDLVAAVEDPAGADRAAAEPWLAALRAALAPEAGRRGGADP
ncbi:CRISPR/Cas system CSM-associated protein Csm3 (group 7 of RAMP superfamily) [Streptomonospora salina]|uniref:CRISPR/Cas system CSM-associated protein Csm3 (Group 7 of RAMP superfamily) n=1 Tax=Streptomonospora salina TaxID=104205 RepID=A0A841EC57_9ACTN|nr:RAMP superfamily CRISPR-associated protein [Streptomonospora salina]MBB6000662.1 CRISPR/Cas system CSM-associated protein Csm3 (group 7 of RAMP superfamily) [Streptomonospora salina]